MAYKGENNTIIIYRWYDKEPSDKLLELLR